MTFVRNALLAGVIIAGFQILQAAFLQNALRQQDRLLVDRLTSSLAEVLNEAHKAKDDVAIYHVVHALRQSSGVVQAFLIFPLVPDVTPEGYLLRDKAGVWGSLFLTLSDRLTRRLVRRQVLIGTLASSLLWGILTVFLYCVENRASNLRAEVAESRGLLELEKNKLCRSEERERLTLLQSSAALQAALERIPEPLIVLDPQQRVWAMNQAAAERLKIGSTEAVLRKSWHEIRFLEFCGPALEQSITAHGQAVEYSTPKEGLRLIFETNPLGLAGTWVTVIRD